MGAELTDLVRQRLTDPNYWHLATIMADGTPQSSPMWIDLRGDLIMINTAKAHLKYRNVRRNPNVSLSNNDATPNPFDHVQIRGKVVEIVDGEKADADIDALARKYIPGAERYEFRAPGEERVSIFIQPTHVRQYAPG